MTKYDERESNDSVGDERLRRVKPRIRLRPPLSLSALCPRPRLISFLFPSLFLFFVSFFRVFHFLNASFRNVRTHFFVSLIERWDSRGSHLSPIVKIEKRERERQREKHGGGDIYGIVDKSCCAALYLLFD